MAMVDVDDSSLPSGGLTAQVDWLGVRVGGHLALSIMNESMKYEPGELSQSRYAMMTAISSWLLLLLLLLL